MLKCLRAKSSYRIVVKLLLRKLQSHCSLRFRAYQHQFETGSHSLQLLTILLLGFENRLGFFLFLFILSLYFIILMISMVK